MSIITAHLIGGNRDCQAMRLSPLLLFYLFSAPRSGPQQSTPHVRDIARHNELKSFPARSWAGGMETVPAWVRRRLWVAGDDHGLSGSASQAKAKAVDSAHPPLKVAHLAQRFARSLADDPPRPPAMFSPTSTSVTRPRQSSR